jgi:hypothetical protein
MAPPPYARDDPPLISADILEAYEVFVKHGELLLWVGSPFETRASESITFIRSPTVFETVSQDEVGQYLRHVEQNLNEWNFPQTIVVFVQSSS